MEVNIFSGINLFEGDFYLFLVEHVKGIDYCNFSNEKIQIAEELLGNQDY